MTRLTDATLRNLKPGSKTLYLKDSEIPQFGVRVTPKGAKAFTVLLGSGKRLTIGRYPLVSLADARNEARRLLAQKTLKLASTGRTRANTAISDFLSDCQKRLRPKTTENYALQLRNLKLSGYLQDITQREIVRQLNTLSESNKEHATRVGKTFFTWCRRQGLIDRNPMELLQASLGKSRDRVLTDQELGEIYHTALKGTDSFSRLIVFLIHTGQRRGEASMLQWEWIDNDTITFPSHVTKNKRQHTIPCTDNLLKYLTQGRRDTLETNVVFCTSAGKPLAGWSKLKPAFDRKLTQVEPWTLHDLRRTFSSGLARLGVPIHITEKILNHVSGTHSGVQAIYNRHSYLPEMREALSTWERHLAKLTSP